MIRIMVADDHAGFRAGLRALLATAEGMEITAEAATGEQAVALVTSVQPDVVLMDLAMPGMGGVAAIERIVRDHPHVRVIALTMAGDDASVAAAIRAGARGYLVEGARKAEIVRAVQAVADGEAIFGAAVAARLAAHFAAPERAAPPFPELTPREREILTLMAARLSNQQIADRLGLSQKTVRNHVSLILGKLRVADRAEAIALAREAGL